MPITVESNAFESEGEAVALIESRGYTAHPSDRETNEVGVHWHDFDAALAIVSGTFELTDVERDVHYVIERGTFFEVTERALHVEKHGPYRVVFGFKSSPFEFERPIDRDPEDHPDRR
jgi:hypothetical protein